MLAELLLQSRFSRTTRSNKLSPRDDPNRGDGDLLLNHHFISPGSRQFAKYRSSLAGPLRANGDEFYPNNSKPDLGPDLAWNCSDKIHHQSSGEDKRARRDKIVRSHV